MKEADLEGESASEAESSVGEPGGRSGKGLISVSGIAEVGRQNCHCMRNPIYAVPMQVHDPLAGLSLRLLLSTSSIEASAPSGKNQLGPLDPQKPLTNLFGHPVLKASKGFDKLSGHNEFSGCRSTERQRPFHDITADRCDHKPN